MPTVQQILTWLLIAVLVIVAIIVLFRLLDILEAEAAPATVVAGKALCWTLVCG